ncbi:MAG: hypothetical protein GX285_08575 [Clostridiales bacterium]|nr:hypothetical protein [Clostridiales bacterium]
MVSAIASRTGEARKNERSVLCAIASGRTLAYRDLIMEAMTQYGHEDKTH